MITLKDQDCPHDKIIPLGNGWGECVACGDDGFPLDDRTSGMGEDMTLRFNTHKVEDSTTLHFMALMRCTYAEAARELTTRLPTIARSVAGVDQARGGHVLDQRCYR